MKGSEKGMMLKFDDAFEIVMDSACRLGTERLELAESLNRITAEDVFSDIDIPPFNKSAMDGYACRRAELANELTVIETIPAGKVPQKVIGTNQCAKIMTGAIVPEGADCVIMKEYVERLAEDTIRFTGKDTDDNICLKGEDVKKAAIVIRSGELISARHIAVLASVGNTSPLVSLQPRVGVIATGNELVEASQKPSAGRIRNSNGPQLAAQLTGAGAIATSYGIAADTKEALNGIIKKAIKENDVVILAGGVSAGDYDLVKQVLKENNIKLLFEKVAVKPGRPVVFGVSQAKFEPAGGAQQKRPVFCFGLPGNPVSSFVMFELLIKPFLYGMAGHNFRPAVTYGKLQKKIKRKKTERDYWLPVVFTEDGKVAEIEYHGSAHINALCKADGLLCVPAAVAELEEGTEVAVRQI